MKKLNKEKKGKQKKNNGKNGYIQKWKTGYTVRDSISTVKIVLHATNCVSDISAPLNLFAKSIFLVSPLEEEKNEHSCNLGFSTNDAFVTLG